MPKHSFKGGVHPLHDQHEGKTSTSGLPIREYIPDSVDIPMSMSIGAPAAPCVKVGDHVKLPVLSVYRFMPAFRERLRP